MLPFAEYRYDAIYFILLILCFAWGGDTAAYFAGRAFGRHKLAPIVSPHKTVEGAVGGVLGSMAAGCVLTLSTRCCRPNTTSSAFRCSAKHYLVLLGMGAVASVLGILGDLFASSVKRQVGIKDYGTIFPGATAVFWTALTASCSSRRWFPSRYATSFICSSVGPDNQNNNRHCTFGAVPFHKCNITLLGSTGSIGTQSLDVCRMHGYEVFGLSANSSVDKLLAQIAEFHPNMSPSPTRRL